MGTLTTHLLDSARGCPAAGVSLELWAILAGKGDTSEERTLVKTAVTNTDGRTDAPLLADEELLVGVYELVFAVGEYFNRFDGSLPDPPFLKAVPIRFGIADPKAHYHVPLLASPWSYSTYRGS